MKQTLKKTLFAVGMSLCAVAFIGCDESSDTQKAADATKDAANKTMDAAKDAAKTTKDAVTDASNKAVDATKDAGHNAMDATKGASDHAMDSTKGSAAAAGDMAKDASASVTAQAQALLDQATTYIKENKLDLADTALNNLDKLKPQLPAEWTPKIDSARSMLEKAKSAMGK